MGIAARLKAARIEDGLTQTALAQGICALSYVSHVEAGRREPSDLMLRKFEDRLGLEHGALQPSAPPVDASAGRVGALLIQAQEELVGGAFASARTTGRTAGAAAAALPNPVAEWMATKVVADAATALGRAVEVRASAARLTELADRVDDASLAIRSRLTAAGTEYLFGNPDSAHRHALTAWERATRLAPGDALRIKALCAVLNTAPDSVGEYEQRLIEEVRHAGDAHIAGAAAWVLGNRAFQDGDVASGLTWHAMALDGMSPAADFRNWARFLRATITERLKAGTTHGVDALLPRAENALDILGSIDELALLAGAQARLALHVGEPENVPAILAPHLAEELPDLTRAELLTLRARAENAIGDLRRGTADALQAAELFTRHDRSAEAEEALALTVAP